MLASSSAPTHALSLFRSRLRARSRAAVTFCTLSSAAAAPGVPFRAASACVGRPCSCSRTSCGDAADPAVACPTAPVGPIRPTAVPVGDWFADWRTSAGLRDASGVLRTDDPASEISRLTPLFPPLASTGPAPASRLLSVCWSAPICCEQGPANAVPIVNAATALLTKSHFIGALRFSEARTPVRPRTFLGQAYLVRSSWLTPPSSRAHQLRVAARRPCRRPRRCRGSAIHSRASRMPPACRARTPAVPRAPAARVHAWRDNGSGNSFR